MVGFVWGIRDYDRYNVYGWIGWDRDSREVYMSCDDDYDGGLKGWIYWIEIR